MNGKRLLKRILATLALALGCVMYLAVVQADAAPIRPDIRKIVAQPQQNTTAEWIPARAGWDGPEMASAQQNESSALQELNGNRLAHAERAELIAAATPDPRAILGIVAIIFLLRLLRREDEKHAHVHSMPGRAPEGEDRIAA